MCDFVTCHIIVVAFRGHDKIMQKSSLLSAQLLHVSGGQVEKSSFDSHYMLGTPERQSVTYCDARMSHFHGSFCFVCCLGVPPDIFGSLPEACCVRVVFESLSGGGVLTVRAGYMPKPSIEPLEQLVEPLRQLPSSEAKKLQESANFPVALGRKLSFDVMFCFPLTGRGCGPQGLCNCAAEIEALRPKPEGWNAA